MSLIGKEGFSEEEFDRELDVSDMGCPIPILRTMGMLQEMEVGEVLHIICTDKGSISNFPALAQTTGNELLEKRIVGDKFHFLLRKKK